MPPAQEEIQRFSRLRKSLEKNDGLSASMGPYQQGKTWLMSRGFDLELASNGIFIHHHVYNYDAVNRVRLGHISSIDDFSRLETAVAEMSNELRDFWLPIVRSSGRRKSDLRTFARELLKIRACD